jgi:hypothetical protein
VKEGNVVATSRPSSKSSAKTESKPTAAPRPVKSETKAPVKIIPQPSGSSARVGINNLKPGQKIKVTVKTGGKKK